MKLNPAEYVILIFRANGISQNRLAILLGTCPANISGWQHRDHKTQAKGTIPAVWRKPLLELAKEHNLDITLEDLEYGREVKSTYIEPDKKLKKQKFYF